MILPDWLVEKNPRLAMAVTLRHLYLPWPLDDIRRMALAVEDGQTLRLLDRAVLPFFLKATVRSGDIKQLRFHGRAYALYVRIVLAISRKPEVTKCPGVPQPKPKENIQRRTRAECRELPGQGNMGGGRRSVPITRSHNRLISNWVVGRRR